MEHLRLTEADERLVVAATQIIQANYVEGKHHVGAAIRGRSGRIYAGVHLESCATSTCAEAVALGVAASSGEREYDSVVAVTIAHGKSPRVISPCGACRELIRHYGSDIAVIFAENGDVRKARVADLLPGAYVDTEP